MVHFLDMKATGTAVPLSVPAKVGIPSTLRACSRTAEMENLVVFVRDTNSQTQFTIRKDIFPIITFFKFLKANFSSSGQVNQNKEPFFLSTRPTVIFSNKGNGNDEKTYINHK